MNMAGVIRTVSRWDQHFDRFSQNLILRVPEDMFGAGIECDDMLAGVDRNDRFRGGRQNARQEGFGIGSRYRSPKLPGAIAFFYSSIFPYMYGVRFSAGPWL